MNKTIRIRTTPGGTDNYIKVKLDNDFDFLEILSLKITQQEIYRTFCADYGVVVGRVIANSGFGISNAKVSVFIPITDSDKNDPLISGLYPYSSVSDKDSNGVRYNLLPKESQGECHNPVGTISSKREFLDNDVLIEVYDKYYKYTTTTNSAGDYLIFGVPVGTYNLHVDVDISDIGGAISQRPYDMIRQGSSPKLFESPTKFKASTNLDTLVQIKSTNKGITIQPFWGDKNNCEVGITRADVDINYHFEPQAIFIGSLFSDNEKNSINKNCRPRTNSGRLCDMIPSQGTIKMIRKTIDGSVESFDVDGGRVIDSNGTWAYQIPMNLDYVITDEFGRIIPSEDPSKGVPTRAEVRFKVSMDVTGGEGRLRTRANYLIPNNPLDSEPIDYSFDETTNQTSSFTTLRWDKLYTVKNFIARYQLDANPTNTNFIGIKNVDDCGSHTPFPYNRVSTGFNPLYAVICIILAIIIDIVYAINMFIISFINNVIIQAIRDMINLIAGIGFPIPDIGFSWSDGITIKWDNIYPFSGLRSIEPSYMPCISLECPSSSGDYFAPGCSAGNGFDAQYNYVLTILNGKNLDNSRNNFSDCIELELGKALNVFQFDFYNDWINGSLYLPLLKYKHGHYCNNDNNYNGYLLDTGVSEGDFNSIPPISSSNKESHVYIKRGIIKNYNDELFYVPRFDDGRYPLYSTDIILLGSTLSCDIDSIPAIHNLLTPTTYKIPEIIDSNIVFLGDELGMDPLFFDNISCFSFYSSLNNCESINTACEIGVDLYNVSGNTELLYNSNINDRIVRRDIIGMASGSTNYNSIDDNFRGNDVIYYKRPTHTVTNDYTRYRNMTIYDGDLNISRGNSLYFYFGIVPGKSAIEVANLKYFTECTIPPIKTLTINGVITNNTDIGGNTGSISITILGGSGSYSYHWSNGMTTPNISGLLAGTYNVTVTETSGLGLTTSRLFTVTEPSPLFFYLTMTPPTSIGNNGTITVNNTTGGISGYTTRLLNNINVPLTGWLPVVSGMYTFTGLSASTYNIIVKDSQLTPNTLENQIQVTNANLLLNSITRTNITCFGSATGTVTVSLTGGTAPYRNTLTDGIHTYTGFTISNLSAGTYTNTLVDSSTPTPQTIITSSIIISSPSKLDYTITHTNITCHDSSTGSIIFSAPSGGIGPYQYTINHGTTWSTNMNYTGLNNGTYITGIKDSNACIYYKGDDDNTYNVGLINPPILNNTSSGGLQQLVLNANGGDSTNYTFTVSGGDPLILGSQANNGIHINPILPKTFAFSLTGATSYNVSVLDNNGCLVNSPVLYLTI